MSNAPAETLTTARRSTSARLRGLTVADYPECFLAGHAIVEAKALATEPSKRTEAQRRDYERARRLAARVEACR